MLLGLALCRYLKDHMPNIQTPPIIAAIMVVLMEFNVVSSVIQSLFEALGSILGLLVAITACLLYVKVGHLSWMFIFLFLVMFISAYYASFRFKYAHVSLMLGAMFLILLLSGNSIIYNPNIMLNRAVGLVLGVLLATLVNCFFWPAYPTRQLKLRISKLMARIAKLLKYAFPKIQQQKAYVGAHSTHLTIEKMIFDIRHLYVDSLVLLSEKRRKYYPILLEQIERTYTTINVILHNMLDISRSHQGNIFDDSILPLQELQQDLRELSACIAKNKGSTLRYQHSLSLYQKFNALIEEKHFDELFDQEDAECSFLYASVIGLFLKLLRQIYKMHFSVAVIAAAD